MDHLWTPWRYAYISRSEPSSEPKLRPGVPPELAEWQGFEDRLCVFCNMIAASEEAVRNGVPRETAEQSIRLVDRGQFCFICLNAYPYTCGHVMITPYQHLASLAELPPDAAQEMMRLAQMTESVLNHVYSPNGINLGMNLGEAAGAGVAGHIHLHVLPRWVGDANFMTVTAETRVLPESLDVTWARVREVFQKKTTPLG